MAYKKKSPASPTYQIATGKWKDSPQIKKLKKASSMGGSKLKKAIGKFF